MSDYADLREEIQRLRDEADRNFDGEFAACYQTVLDLIDKRSEEQ